ncbi:unnamed protein product, partial [marine sediment metagenome]
EQIEVLMEEWNIDKIQDLKFPSKTDLDKFFKAKVIDVNTYKTEMTNLGYSMRYISWYAKLLGIK